ncbi:hypothetical protein JTB14_022282 [Gonioctena quinquepunctata]|nr:hypothetical protein JTB14_022282 [Gonioctena quinquepunctata]
MSRARRDNQSDIETQAQQFCETIISSELILKKLVEVITAKIPAMIESHIKVYEEKVNLRVYGVSDERSQDGSHVSIFKNKMKLTVNEEDEEYSYRLPVCKKGVPQPLLVKFRSKEKRNSVFYDKCKLKGTNVVIREDLTPTRYGLSTNAAIGDTNTWSMSGQVRAKINGKLTEIVSFDDIAKFL